MQKRLSQHGATAQNECISMERHGGGAHKEKHMRAVGCVVENGERCGAGKETHA